MAERPDVPGARLLLENVELISFAYLTEDGTERDTIRGALAVSNWLESMRMRAEETHQPFQLRASEIDICDGAAVEAGKFPVSGDLVYMLGTGLEQRYLALWRPTDAGWRIERLLLAPADNLGIHQLATGCEASVVARRESRRLWWGGAIRTGSGAGMDELNALMVEAGLPEPSRTARGAISGTTWAFYRLGPKLAVRPLYARLGRAQMHTFRGAPSSSYGLTVDVSGHTVAGLAEAEVGPVWIGAGPALALTKTVRTITRTGYNVNEYVEEKEWTPLFGGMAEATLRIRRVPGIVPLVSLGYTYLPALSPELIDPASISFQGLTITLGMEVAP